MSLARSVLFDVALLLAFAFAVRAHGQVVSWSHAVSATTLVTVGVRLDPRASHALDRVLRPLSPYRASRLADGSFVLPDYRLTAHTCDAQFLHWSGIGDWSGPRIVTTAFWLPVSYLGTRLTNAPITLTGIATYTGVRLAVIPSYRFDPLAYANMAAFSIEGAALGSHRSSWTLTASLVTLWLVVYPWATPTPGNC